MNNTETPTNWHTAEPVPGTEHHEPGRLAKTATCETCGKPITHRTSLTGSGYGTWAHRPERKS